MNTRPGSAKQGIALVIVLGFLSVIMVMAVAFAIVMRTERLATRNYVDVVRARLLLQAALAESLEDIDNNISTGPDMWYPAWTVRGSTVGTDPCAGMLGGEALSHVPDSLRGDAQLEAGALNWQPINDPEGKLVGRYAYLAVDCSGLLDANWISGVLPRGYGKDVSEIRIDANLLPEVNNVPNFLASRTSRLRFESLPELHQLGRVDGFMTPAQPPDHLFVYSYFPWTQYWDSAVGPAGALANQVYIGGSLDEVKANDAAIKAQFLKMGIADSGQRDAIFLNLVDYLDSDDLPGELRSFCTEAVPMVNEIQIVNTVTRFAGGVPADLRNEFAINVELWYPFVSDAADTYKVQYQLRMQTPFPNTVLSDVTAAQGGWLADRYKMFNNAAGTLSQDYSGAFPPASWPNQYIIAVQVLRNTDNQVVDLVQIRVDSSPQLVTAADVALLPAAGGSVSRQISKECDDPRINWSWSDATQWGVGSSPDGQNMLASFAVKDGTWEMYVRNSDRMDSVGEMGFLLYDVTKPWQTIPLFGPNGMPVLDLFIITNCVFRKGLVNPNTTDPNVLASVFMNMPVGFPGAEEGVVNDWQCALDLAQAFQVAGPFSGLSGLTNVADIGAGSVGAVLQARGFPLSAAHKFGRESVLRNSIGLLSTRQNVLTLFIAAQAVDDTADDGVGPEDIRAEQHAVAVVWRDPFPNSAGDCPAFVRFFRWLPE
jgi:hypothetical protein